MANKTNKAYFQAMAKPLKEEYEAIEAKFIKAQELRNSLKAKIRDIDQELYDLNTHGKVLSAQIAMLDKQEKDAEE